MNLLQMFCTLLQGDMNDYLKSQNPEDWEALMKTAQELKAAAEGEPAGDLAMRALAELYPYHGPALAVETAVRGETGTTYQELKAVAKGEPAGDLAMRALAELHPHHGPALAVETVGRGETGTAYDSFMKIIRDWSDGTPDRTDHFPATGQEADDADVPAGLPSPILTALAQLATGIQPKDGSTAEEALHKAMAVVNPVAETQAMAREAAWAAGMPVDAMLDGLSVRNVREALTNRLETAGPALSPMQAMRLLAIRDGQEEAGKPGRPDIPNIAGHFGPTGYAGHEESGGRDRNSDPTFQDSLALHGDFGSCLPDSGSIPDSGMFPETADPSHFNAWQVWHAWQAQKEEEERAAGSSTAIISEDEEFRYHLTGRLPRETLAGITNAKEILDLIDTTPLGTASGRAVAGSPDMGIHITFAINNLNVHMEPDRSGMTEVATAITAKLMRDELDALWDNYDDGLLA